MIGSVLKRLVVGPPRATAEMGETLLPKSIALPIFSSDALSSIAYAVQEQLLVLSLAGAAALSLSIPVSIAISLLFAIVVLSYRQIVKAYPSGGGSYIVARENIGQDAGILVAAALLVDYTMTVAVSNTAGVDAIVAAVPSLAPYRVWMVLGLIAFVMMMNLRGVKESGSFFAVPTYGFLISMYALIVVGFIRCLGGCPQAPTAGQALPVIEPVTLFLILKTFAAGTTALTGIEAIADSVPAFRFPQSRNAAFTLAVLGAIAISMLVGVAWLAHGTGVVYNPDSPYTVIAQIGIAVFDKGIMFYVIQVTTAAILILAANTAFNGFPVLMYILARDRIMPRFFLNRGDRLALSNGILILAFFAGLVVYVFQASLNHLLQLYLIGVFVSFTLAQGGTALRWSRLKPPGWQRRAAINWFGAVMTGIVLGIVLVTKFLSGAWIVVALIPVLVYLMKGINRHLEDLKKELTAPSRRTQGRRRHQHVVLLVTRVDAATARAIGYVRGMRPDSATAVTFEAFNCPVWRRLVPYYPIQVLARREGMVTDLRRYLHVMRGRLAEDDFLTVVVPETLHSRALTDVVRSPTLQAVKAALLYEPGIQVLDIPIVAGDIDPDVDEARETVRNDVVVLAAGVNNATLQALKYAETLHPTSIRAVNFGLIPEESEKLVEDWLAEDIPYPLEIDDSPFRDIGRSLTAYVREMHPDGVRRIVTVILPEFVVPTRRHQLLHGQTGLVAKRYLLFERGVVVVSVPYHIHPERVREEARR